jgi:LysR family transcriptional regulator, chromosome initiation inhibitor
MSLLSPHVSAFIAVIEEASFEGAARRLSVTPSAISQRIKQLENRIGHLLIVRQFPCKPTPAGEQLLSRVKPMSLIEAEVMADLHPDSLSDTQAQTFPIAVNEDSLTTWLLGALASLNTEHGHLFDIRIDDQDYTLDYLRNGTVIGAVTSEKTPLQGCETHELGSMRYCGIASPEFFERYFSQGLTIEAFKHAPMLTYNRKDPLQMRFIKLVTSKTIYPANVHYLPDSMSMFEAVKLNMGWCITAEGLLDEAIEKEQVVNMDPNISLNEPLYWQHVGVRSRSLSQITQFFRSASSKVLHR